MPAYGAYAREIVLAKPDGRTREGRLLVQMRRALINSLGGEAKLTPQQRVLVERCAMLQLRVAVLDKKICDGTFSDFDGKTYLAFSNALTRTLSALGLQPHAAKQPPVDPMQPLRDHLAQRARERETEAA